MLVAAAALFKGSLLTSCMKGKPKEREREREREREKALPPREKGGKVN